MFAFSREILCLFGFIFCETGWKWQARYETGGFKMFCLFVVLGNVFCERNSFRGFTLLRKYIFLFLDFIQCSDLWLEVIFTNFKMAGPFWLHTKVYTYFIYSTVYITAIIIWDEAEEIQTYLKIPLTVSIKHIICSYHTIKTFGHSHHNHNKMLLTWSYLKLAFP